MVLIIDQSDQIYGDPVHYRPSDILVWLTIYLYFPQITRKYKNNLWTCDAMLLGHPNPSPNPDHT